MKITTEDLGSRQILLTIEVDPERVDSALHSVARRISREYSIPGFRRGRAPYHIVLRRFGREALLQEVLDDLGQEVVQEALEKEDVEPYGAGSLDDVQLDPLVLKLRVPLRPTVELGDYRALRLEAEAVVVDEAEIDTELERLRQDNAILEPAGERPAQMGDWVSVDVKGDVGGESFVREEGYGMVLDPEDKEFELGFSEQIVGMAPGEDKEFTLTLGENWGEEKIGKEATFSATVGEIRSRLIPELDDDLARTVGDYDTLEELAQAIRARFEEKAQGEADGVYTEEVLGVLVDSATIEYPPDLIDDQIDDLAKDLERRLEPQGIKLDDYVKLTGQTEEAFRDSLRPQAETIVRRGLVLGEVARQEELDVEGTEVDQRIALLSSSWGEQAGEVREVLSEPDSLRSIANTLLTDKAVQRLVAITKGEAPPLDAAGDEGVEEPDPVPAETESEGTEQGNLKVVDTSAQEPEAILLENVETPDVEAGESPEIDL